MTIELAELVKLITAAWPHRWTQGRILHVHQNNTRLPDGSIAHVRVLVQQISDPPKDSR